MNAGDIYSIPK